METESHSGQHVLEQGSSLHSEMGGDREGERGRGGEGRREGEEGLVKG